MWRGWFFRGRLWQVLVSVGWAAEVQFDSWRCGYGSRSRTHGCWFESLHRFFEVWFNSVASFLYTLRRCERPRTFVKNGFGRTEVQRIHCSDAYIRVLHTLIVVNWSRFWVEDSSQSIIFSSAAGFSGVKRWSIFRHRSMNEIVLLGSHDEACPCNSSFCPWMVEGSSVFSSSVGVFSCSMQ